MNSALPMVAALALFGMLARLATGRLVAVPSRRTPLPGAVVFLIFSSLRLQQVA